MTSPASCFAAVPLPFLPCTRLAAQPAAAPMESAVTGAAGLTDGEPRGTQPGTAVRGRLFWYCAWGNTMSLQTELCAKVSLIQGMNVKVNSEIDFVNEPLIPAIHQSPGQHHSFAALRAQQMDYCAAAKLQASLEGGIVRLNASLGARLPGEQPLPKQGAAQRAAAVNAGLHSIIHRPVAQWKQRGVHYLHCDNDFMSL